MRGGATMQFRQYLMRLNTLAALLLELDESQLQGVIDLIRSYIG